MPTGCKPVGLSGKRIAMAKFIDTAKAGIVIPIVPLAFRDILTSEELQDAVQKHLGGNWESYSIRTRTSDMRHELQLKSIHETPSGTRFSIVTHFEEQSTDLEVIAQH